MKIAVTGANGWLGREVCAWLRTKGADVRPLCRSGDIEGSRFLDLLADETDSAWNEAFRGCESVIHCAGHVHRASESVEEQRLFAAINVDGTRKLLNAVNAANVARFIFVSTSAIYDWNAVTPATEAGAVRPTTCYGWSKSQAEELVRQSKLDWRIARLGTVFGIGDKANFARLARGLRTGRFLLPGDGTARKSVLPIAKAGEILGRLAMDDFPNGLILNVAAPGTVSLGEICQAFSKQCRLPPPRRVPLTVMSILALFGDIAAVIEPRFPFRSSILAKLTTSTVLDVSRMQECFPDVTWKSFEETLNLAAAYYANV